MGRSEKKNSKFFFHFLFLDYFYGTNLEKYHFVFYLYRQQYVTRMFFENNKKVCLISLRKSYCVLSLCDNSIKYDKQFSLK